MGKRGDYSKLFGTKQGMLKIIGEESRPGKLDGSGKITLHLVCECECGKTCYVIPSEIVTKRKVSCGCIRKQRLGISNSHGMSKTRFYRIWCGILKRCNNEKSRNYINYGGRGIKVCEEWNDFIKFKYDMYESYEAHVKRHGEYDTSVERLKVDGDYTKENCTWATRKEQNTNNRQVKHYEYKGEILDLAEIARREGMKYTTLRAKLLYYGWTLEEVLEKSHLKWSNKKSEIYDYKGQQLTLNKIAELEGIGYTTMRNRVKIMGLNIEDAINKVPHIKTR